MAADGTPVELKIEVTVVNLVPEQTRRFKDYIEWWDEVTQKLLEAPPGVKEQTPRAVVTALKKSRDSAAHGDC